MPYPADVPPPSPEVTAHVQRVLATFPPPTDAQLDKLAALLRPTA